MYNTESDMHYVHLIIAHRKTQKAPAHLSRGVFYFDAKSTQEQHSGMISCTISRNAPMSGSLILSL